MNSLFFLTNESFKFRSSGRECKVSWQVVEWMMTTWMMAAGPISCYGVWMRMMRMKTPPTNIDFLLQVWMQKENMVRNSRHAIANQRNVATAAGSRATTAECTRTHAHTHTGNLNIQTHLSSSLDRENTHTKWKSCPWASLTATPSVVTVTHPPRSSSASFQSHWQANNESQQGHQHQHNNHYYHDFLFGTTDRSVRLILTTKRIRHYDIHFWYTSLIVPYIIPTMQQCEGNKNPRVNAQYKYQSWYMLLNIKKTGWHKSASVFMLLGWHKYYQTDSENEKPTNKANNKTCK